MSRSMTVVVLVEGQTENGFVKDVLAPYWGQRGIFVQAPIYRTHVDMRSGRVHREATFASHDLPNGWWPC